MGGSQPETLALKVEEGTTGQEMGVACRGWKRQEMGFPLQPLEKNAILILAQYIPVELPTCHTVG